MSRTDYDRLLLAVRAYTFFSSPVQEGREARDTFLTVDPQDMRDVLTELGWVFSCTYARGDDDKTPRWEKWDLREKTAVMVPLRKTDPTYVANVHVWGDTVAMVVDRTAADVLAQALGKHDARVSPAHEPSHTEPRARER